MATNMDVLVLEAICFDEERAAERPGTRIGDYLTRFAPD